MPITFDKSAARFRDENGLFLADNFVRGTVERTTLTLEADLRAAAADLINNRINIAEFQTRAASSLKIAHILNASIGKGGRRQMTQTDWGLLGAKIREQYKFLNNFASEIEAGLVLPAQIENRIALYSKAARSVYFKFEKLTKTEIGLLFARRVLNAFENCKDCAYWASRGFIPIEEQPEIGSLICKSFCKCWFEYSTEAAPPKGSRAKGFFFTDEENFPYEPAGASIGQTQDYSCVAASTRMILSDNDIDLPEAFLRNALETNETGTALSKTVKLLNDEIKSGQYIFNRKTDFETLRASVEKGSAIVNVRRESLVHSLIVDKIEDDMVFLRDPLPVGKGKAYAVSVQTFQKRWLISGKNHGLAVIIK